jgi:nitroreductase family protein
MSDAVSELAELLDRYGSWQVEYQDHLPAWIAIRRPSPALAAHDLGSLREKLASAETLSQDSLPQDPPLELAELRVRPGGRAVELGMETWDAIRARRNVRQYSGQPIAREDLERVCEAGRRAPSAGNWQPWTSWWSPAASS